MARVLLKVNKIKVRTSNAARARARDKDKDSKDNRDHKVAGTRTPAPSRAARDNKVSKASKTVKAVWASREDSKAEWAMIAIQAVVPRAEAARVVAWVPDKERTTYK